MPDQQDNPMQFESTETHTRSLPADNSSQGLGENAADHTPVLIRPLEDSSLATSRPRRTARAPLTYEPETGKWVSH